MIDGLSDKRRSVVDFIFHFLIRELSLNCEDATRRACEKVVGGHSEAKTTGKASRNECTPTGCHIEKDLLEIPAPLRGAMQAPEEPYMIGGWRESSEAGLLAPSELTANWELGSLISSLSSFPGLK